MTAAPPPAPSVRPQVVQLQRSPVAGQVSIEHVFATVRAHLHAVDVRVHTSPFPNRGVLPRLRALLDARHHQGDVTHMVGDSHYLTLLLRRASTILTVHDLEFVHRPGKARWRKVIFSWLWLRLPIMRCAEVTAVSEATRDDLVEWTGIDAARVHVIPNPVRDVFTPAPLPDNDVPVILMIGTWPTKNLHRSAQALAGLDVRIVLIGPLSAEQRQWFAGQRLDNRIDLSEAELVATMHGCDLLLFPSLKEGFGLPVVEAQACGRPVVTSDRSPTREVSGGAAELVDPEDVESIRAGVQRVLTDPDRRDRLVRDGLANAARFRPEPIADAYQQLYLDVAARRRWSS